ncbi:MAG: VOC family protein, partial [Lysobacteraceae bacterium]
SNKPGAVIFAKDIARVARFYEHAVAMANVHSDDDCIVLESTHLQLTVHAIPKAVADCIETSESPMRRSNVAVKLCFPVSSLGDAHQHAVAFGGGMNSLANAWKGVGFVACDGHDPEGNVIQFREFVARLAMPENP